MATVDSVDTPMMVKPVSFPGSSGGRAAGDGHRRGRAADRGGAEPVSRPNSVLKPIARASHIEIMIVSVTTATTRATGCRSSSAISRAVIRKQRDAEPQHGAAGEADAGLAAVDVAQEVHRHAEQQREQHHRPGIMIGQ